MSQIVMMPVKALNEKCVNCPMLDIVTDNLEINADGIEIGRKNKLSCNRWKICERAYNFGLKEATKAAQVVDENESDMNNPWLSLRA